MGSLLGNRESPFLLKGPACTSRIRVDSDAFFIVQDKEYLSQCGRQNTIKEGFLSGVLD